jgi:hypothetical protein
VLGVGFVGEPHRGPRHLGEVRRPQDRAWQRAVAQGLFGPAHGPAGQELDPAGRQQHGPLNPGRRGLVQQPDQARAPVGGRVAPVEADGGVAAADLAGAAEDQEVLMSMDFRSRDRRHGMAPGKWRAAQAQTGS